jgi:hypothetical protein
VIKTNLTHPCSSTPGSKCTTHYIDEVFILNNSKFNDYVDPIELEIKYTTDITRSTSYLDLHIDNDSEGRVRAKLKDKMYEREREREREEIKYFNAILRGEVF